MNECDNQLHQIEIRAAVFKNGKILLIKQDHTNWMLPGGFCNASESIFESIKNKVLEQTGTKISITSVISIQTQPTTVSHGLCKILLLCAISEESSVPTDPQHCSCFGLGAFPPLALEYTTEDQVHLCFDAMRSQNFKTTIN